MSSQDPTDPSDNTYNEGVNGHLGPTWEIALGVILAVVVLLTALVAIYQLRKRRRLKREARSAHRDPEMIETTRGRVSHSRTHKHRSTSSTKSAYHPTRDSPNSSSSHISAGLAKPPRAARSSSHRHEYR